jgi:hypothetical protein
LKTSLAVIGFHVCACTLSRVCRDNKLELEAHF